MSLENILNGIKTKITNGVKKSIIIGSIAFTSLFSLNYAKAQQPPRPSPMVQMGHLNIQYQDIHFSEGYGYHANFRIYQGGRQMINYHIPYGAVRGSYVPPFVPTMFLPPQGSPLYYPLSHPILIPYIPEPYLLPSYQPRRF